MVVAAMLCYGQMNMAEAQNNKQLARAQKKEYKTKMKEYKKEGWKIFGTSHSLDVALLTHYDKLSKEGVTEVTANTKSSNKNIGKEKLFMAACADYAKRAGSHIKGRIVQDMGSIISTDELAEFEHFYDAYENNVQKEINGELQNSYMVYRSLGKQNGVEVFEFQAYFLVDEAAASKARIRAYENAAKESAAAQKYAERVSKFIKEGFED